MSILHLLFYLNIDRISFNINHSKFPIDQQINGFKLIKNKTKYNSNYQIEYSIFHNNILFAKLHLSHNNNKHQHHLSVDNKPLYTHHWITILKSFFTTYEITDYTLSSLEIAINTNINILNKWYSFFKKDKEHLLNIKKNYYEFPILPNSKARLSKYVSNDTIYIKKKNAPVEMRLENKTFEIATKITRQERDKKYILDFYSDYLDTTKDIFRLEMAINFRLLRKASKSKIYSLKDNPYEFITVGEFNKLSSYMQNKYIPNNNQMPKSIPLDLLADNDFLLSFFDNHSTFDYKLLIPTKPKPLKFDNIITPIIEKEKRIISNSHTRELDKQLNAILNDVQLNEILNHKDFNDFTESIDFDAPFTFKPHNRLN